MIKVEMPYIGNVLSVNHCYTMTKHLKPEARKWREALAFAVRNQFSLKTPLVKPVRVQVWGIFVNKREQPDLDNLAKIILDAVELGTGINDRDMRFEARGVRYGSPPTLIIEIGE